MKPKTFRCAVYTRKSTEAGLEQEFNSLQAQTESCKAYILSQAGEGWSALDRSYSDGGISGGHMDRPIELVVLKAWVTETKDTLWASKTSTSLAKSDSERVSLSTL